MPHGEDHGRSDPIRPSEGHGEGTHERAEAPLGGASAGGAAGRTNHAHRNGREGPGGGESGGGGAAQDLALRLLSAGLSSVFSTQEALRRAVGDALPVEWVQFASQQSERARDDFFDRMTEQMAAMMEKVDPNEVIKALLRDHVVEVKASIRLRPGDDATGGRIETTLRADAEDESD